MLLSGRSSQTPWLRPAAVWTIAKMRDPDQVALLRIGGKFERRAEEAPVQTVALSPGTSLCLFGSLKAFDRVVGQ
jgi:hypothetical protein